MVAVIEAWPKKMQLGRGHGYLHPHETIRRLHQCAWVIIATAALQILSRSQHYLTIVILIPNDLLYVCFVVFYALRLSRSPRAAAKPANIRELY